ncbi:glycosyl hydrolase, partial [Marivirga lumbricoides]
MKFKSYYYPFLLIFFSTLSVVNCLAQEQHYVDFSETDDSFPLVTQQGAASFMISESDFKGVIKVAGHLQNDILRVTGQKPVIISDLKLAHKKMVIIGTLGKSKLIDQLVANGKLDVSLLKGKWEKFTTQTVEKPFPGVEQALVIAGSDKRGTIYGMYDLSRQIGVHPWHFWADIPAQKHPELYVKSGIHTLGEPKVKYRGIFINDEAPALAGWAYERYGGFNAQFYDKVFELILRMRGNYLWPAMWGRMFYVDDPKNAELADEYGIVMGTSHHEPLTRAHAEWKQFGKGDWNYNTNP